MYKAKALIVDDEPDIRELIQITLERMDIDSDLAMNINAAKDLLKENDYSFCLTDLKLPDGSGLDLVTHVQEEHPNLPIAVITAFGNMDIAVSALKRGAFDFISKPLNLKHFRKMIESVIKLKDNQADKSQQEEDPIAGKSPLIIQLKDKIRKVSRSQAPVFIHGESGTGKELVARMIHRYSPRNQSPFIAVNCGAIPTELMESEFFGHKKGSFTGASQDKVGLFQAAQGGTLFLDEVADLPKAMQVKLLRAIQERSVRPIGANKEISIDCRILSATHKNLAKEVSDNNFRQDLFYRINVINIEVPPLRNRKEDIEIITKIFLERISNTWNTEKMTLNEEAALNLTRYPFPGNVRELENILEKAVTLCDGSIITPENLSLPMNQTVHQENDESTPSLPDKNTNKPYPVRPPDQPLQEYLNNIEKQAIIEALEETRWNRTAAAKLLGMTFRSLRYRLKKLNIDDEQ